MKDCEAIRKKLLGRRADPEDRKWTILGQSFGGFCAITYLSFYSEGLKEVFLTGGLPPLIDSLDTIYDKLASESVLEFMTISTLMKSLREGDQTE